jgi:hypothetical protein
VVGGGGSQWAAYVDEHVELRRVDEGDASDDHISAQVHPKEIRTMIRVVQYHVPPPRVTAAVDEAAASHRDVIAVVELQSGLAAVAPIAAARPRAVEAFSVPIRCIQYIPQIGARIRGAGTHARRVPSRRSSMSDTPSNAA